MAGKGLVELVFGELSNFSRLKASQLHSSVSGAMQRRYFMANGLAEPSNLAILSLREFKDKVALSATFLPDLGGPGLQQSHFAGDSGFHLEAFLLLDFAAEGDLVDSGDLLVGIRKPGREASVIGEKQETCRGQVQASHAVKPTL